MKIIFNIQYKTVFGEELLLNVVGNEADDTVLMSTADGCSWSCQLTVDGSRSHVDYYYTVRGYRGIKRSEWKTIVHRLDLSASAATHYEVDDVWQDIPGDTYLYSSAFTDCVNRRPHAEVAATSYERTLRLVVRAPQLRSGSRLAVVGDNRALGRCDRA